MKTRKVLGIVPALFLALSVAGPAGAYPLGGTDILDTVFRIEFTLFDIVAADAVDADFGVSNVLRGNPFDPGDGKIKINTEILSMDLTGVSETLATTIILRESPFFATLGMIQQQTAGNDFPADGMFDAFIELEFPDLMPGMVFGIIDPILLVTDAIDDIPPLNDVFFHFANGQPINIWKLESGVPVGQPVGLIGNAFMVFRGEGPPVVVPEPSSLLLVCLGAVGLLGWSRRRMKRSD